MARLEDPVILAMYMSALSNWHVAGYVNWKPKAEEWLTECLPNQDPKAFAKVMHDYVRDGGEIDQVRERRPEWNDRDYHYDLRIPLGNKVIYIETLLIDDDPKDPTIEVVSVHYA